MDNAVAAFFTGVIGVVMFIAGYNASSSMIIAEAVKTECAQYNPVSGDFEWIEK